MSTNIERMGKCFKDHKATFTDYGNIKILDFKNPNSCEYRVRFLFEEDYYRLHISGDLGELIAENSTNMTYEKFARDFANNIGYFEGKIRCHSRALYCYDEDALEKELKEVVKEADCYDALHDEYGYFGDEDETDEEVFLSFFNDVCGDFEPDRGLGTKAWEKITEFIDSDYLECHWDMGKERSDILDWYMLAFKLAQEDLEKSMCNEIEHWELESDEIEPNPMFKLVVCPYCNEKANNTYKFCPYCGKRVRGLTNV